MMICSCATATWQFLSIRYVQAERVNQPCSAESEPNPRGLSGAELSFIFRWEYLEAGASWLHSIMGHVMDTVKQNPLFLSADYEF